MTVEWEINGARAFHSTCAESRSWKSGNSSGHAARSLLVHLSVGYPELVFGSKNESFRIRIER